MAAGTLHEIQRLASQLKLEMALVFKEIQWALGEERIDRVTPDPAVFREWRREPIGMLEFWKHAEQMLGCALTQDEVADMWECIDLTLNRKVRRGLTFQEYLMIAARSDQKCEVCGRRPPDVSLDIDHIIPVSRGGDNVYFNLRFLCEHHNRARGRRFRWADVWRRPQ
jgi:hypothetical protein